MQKESRKWIDTAEAESAVCVSWPDTTEASAFTTARGEGEGEGELKGRGKVEKEREREAEAEGEGAGADPGLGS